MAEIIAKAYDFRNDNDQRIEGINYFVRVNTKDLGAIDLKIVTKSETDKRLLEKIAQPENK